jgi:hypothetical protein
MLGYGLLKFGLVFSTLLAACGVSWSGEQETVASVGSPAVLGVSAVTSGKGPSGTLFLETDAHTDPGTLYNAKVVIKSKLRPALIPVGSFLVNGSETETQGYAFDLKSIAQIDQSTLDEIGRGDASVQIDVTPLAGATDLTTKDVLSVKKAEFEK